MSPEDSRRHVLTPAKRYIDVPQSWHRRHCSNSTRSRAPHGEQLTWNHLSWSAVRKLSWALTDWLKGVTCVPPQLSLLTCAQVQSEDPESWIIGVAAHANGKTAMFCHIYFQTTLKSDILRCCIDNRRCCLRNLGFDVNIKCCTHIWNLNAKSTC